VGEHTVVVRDPAGARLAEITVRGARVTVEPPEAEDLPLVAAVLAQVRTTASRPRPRPSC
jgi:hypothetical protein